MLHPQQLCIHFIAGKGFTEDVTPPTVVRSLYCGEKAVSRMRVAWTLNHGAFSLSLSVGWLVECCFTSTETVGLLGTGCPCLCQCV